MPAEVERLTVSLEASVKRFENEMRKARTSADRSLRDVERRFDSSTKNIENSFARLGTRLQSGVASLAGRVGGALAAALGANELRRYADAWTLAGNKIAAAGEAAESLGARQSEIADIAIRSRSDFGSIADLYAGLRRSTEQLGASQAQVLVVTETIGKGFSVSGTSASDAANSIRQLNQAFDIGALRGEELNAVLEGAPSIARLVAKEFGVTTGELKKLAEAGKLTSDKVFSAILKGAGDIEAEFAKTNPTIAQAFGNLSTAFTRYVGQADQATGASRTFAGAVQSIADNINVAAPAAAVLAAALLGAFVGGPIGAGIAGITTGLVAFGDAVQPISGDLATLGDYARVAFGMIGTLGAEAGAKLSAGFQRAAELTTVALSGINAGDALGSLLEGVKAALNATIGAFVAAVEAIRVSWVALGPVLAETMVGAMNAVIATVQGAVNKIVGAVNAITGAVNAAGSKVGVDVGFGTIGNVDLGQIRNSFSGAGKAAGDAYGKAFDAIGKDYIGSTLSAASAGLDALRTKANQAAAQRILRTPTGSTDNGSLDAPLKSRPGAADGKAGKGGGGQKADDFEREAQALERRTRALDSEREAVGRSAFEAAKAEAAFRLLEAAKKANLPVTDALRQKIDTLATAYATAKVTLDEAEERQRQFEAASREAGSTLSDAFQGAILRGEKLIDVVNRLISSLASRGVDSLFDALFGRGGAGTTFLSGIFGGGTGLPAGGFNPSGYAGGGYTGPGGRRKPAGIVHAGEDVWSRDDIRRAGGIKRVEELRRNGGFDRGYERGGYVGNAPMLPLAPPAITARRGGGGTRSMSIAPVYNIAPAAGVSPGQLQAILAANNRELQRTFGQRLAAWRENN